MARKSFSIRMGQRERVSLQAFSRTKKELELGKKKFLKVLREFKRGVLTSRGKKIGLRSQAIAIAFSEAKKVIKSQRRRKR